MEGGVIHVDEDRTLVAEPEQMQATIQMGAQLGTSTQMLSPTLCPICGQNNPPGETYCIECGFLLSSAVPDVPVDDKSYPKLRDTAGGREFLLKAGANIVGRDPAADILLNDGTVSRRHAQVIIEENIAFLEELGSTNGTKLNGQPVSVGERIPLGTGAEVRFGNITLVLDLPEGFETPEVAVPSSEDIAAYLVSATDPGQRYPLRTGANKIGRRDSNDIVLPDPYVSGQHALIEIAGTSVRLTDLGSTNGTFIEGERLAPNMPTVITEETAFTLGQTAVRLEWATELTELSESSELSDQPDLSEPSEPTEPTEMEESPEEPSGHV
jgi:pSer/pThr/pTyr-binding forkhead associated (FHA) protein